MTENDEKQENTTNMSQHAHSYQHDTVLDTHDNSSPSKRKDSSAGENFLRFNHVLWPGTSSSHNGHQPAMSDELFEFEETQYKRSKTRYDLVTMFLLWIGCMLLGTFYFRESSCCENRYGLSFYMAVNVFYAIGWSHPTNAATEESDTLRYFSSFYLVVGTIFFYTAVGYFIHLIIDQNSKHYANFIACEVAADHSTNASSNNNSSSKNNGNSNSHSSGCANSDMGHDDSSDDAKGAIHPHPDPRSLGVSDVLERGGGGGVGVVGVVVGHYSHRQHSRPGSISSLGVPLSQSQSLHRTDHHHITYQGASNNSTSSSSSPPSTCSSLLSMAAHCWSSPLWQSWDSAQDTALRFLHVNSASLLDLCMLLAWIVWGIVFGKVVIEWTFSEALYFSLSTLSAGGMYSIPQDSSDIAFALAGIFAATGIPITAMVVGNLVKTWISHMGRTKMASYLRRKIHDAEFEVLRSESMDASGKLDVAKFLLLMFVRQRVVDMRLIDVVLERVRQAEQQQEQQEQEAGGGTVIKSSYLLGSGSGSQGSRTPSTEDAVASASAPGVASGSDSGVVAVVRVRHAAFAQNAETDEYKAGYD